MPTKTLYDRYWDLHLTAANGSYDFAPFIATQAAFQGIERSAGLGNQLDAQKILISVGSHSAKTANILTPLPVQNLPAHNGYAASTAKIKSVKNRVFDSDVALLVNWINDPNFRSKLRINCHGDAGGVLSMGETRAGVAGADPDNAMSADAVVAWLKEHGLRQGGLKTINVCACYSALDEHLLPNSRNSRKDETSAIRRIAKALTTRSITSPFEITGVEVTGSDEPISGNGVGRNLSMPSGGGWGAIQEVQAGSVTKRNVVYQQVFFRLQVAANWILRTTTFHPSGRFLLPPANAAVQPAADNPSRKPNSGWTVAGTEIPERSNWLVFQDVIDKTTLDISSNSQVTNANEELRFVVIPAPGWEIDASQGGNFLKTSPFIHLPGDQAVPADAQQRLAQSTGKERVFS